jgi:hypothetical protein
MVAKEEKVMKITRVLLLIAILFMILVTSKVFGASADEPDSVTGVTGDLALNHTITVKVSPPKYLDGKELDKFLLYLDWRPIKGVTARLIKNGLDKENPGQLFPDRLAFDVKRTGDSKDQWNALLGSPKGFSKETAISIGYGNEKPINTKIDKYPLIVIKSTWFWIFIALFILAVVGFLYLARTTAIIRDPSTLDPEKRPYSLGRTQMAFWFFIVVASYIFLWIVTGDFETITKQVLVLMGISASSALGAVAIDKHKDNVNKRNFQKLQEERKALQARLKTLEDSINEAIEPERSILQNEQANKKARKSQVIEEIDEL